MRLGSAKRSLLAGLLLAVSVAATSCYRPPGPGEFTITVTARSDRGRPLPGVQVWSGGTRLGQTGEGGGLAVTVSALEGTRWGLRAVCPSGYRSPERDHALMLRPFSSLGAEEGSAPLTLDVECRPVRRFAAIVIRADEQEGLPVRLHGRELARTDEHGVAHVLLAMAPQTTATLELDTSARPDLKPQNPVSTVAIGDEDELFVVDQAFEAKKPKKVRIVRRRKKKPKRRGPIKVE